MSATVVRRSHGSDAYVSGLQRSRLLSATFALVGERGYEGVTARGVSERAGVSNRTFYECFSDREDCFLAAFNHALEGLELEMRAGWESELGWTGRVRAALDALLHTLDREPAVRRLVFVEALVAGPRVLTRRARVLESLAAVIDEGRANAKAPAGLLGDPGRSALVAEGVVGGAFGVIHARLLELSSEPLTGLLGALMAMIVLPYRGGAAAARELSASAGLRGASRSRTREARRASHASDRGRRDAPPIVPLRPLGSASPVDYRLTVRAQMALAAVAGRPGLNNREVSEVIGLADQGQVSRMMKRLVEQGFVENIGRGGQGAPKAWYLTREGDGVVQADLPVERGVVLGKAGPDFLPGERPAKSGRPEENLRSLRRLTALTHLVLTAVAGLGEQADPTNREIANAAGVKDEGQISRLLRRLEDHGLLRNGGGASPAAGNAWRLTRRGEELLSASCSGEGRLV